MILISSRLSGLGYMGYAGIPLDLTTLLVANICLGLVVDDTTHFSIPSKNSTKRMRT